jgi:hypothetical protein
MFQVKFRLPKGGAYRDVEVFDLINAQQASEPQPLLFEESLFEYRWRVGALLTRDVIYPFYIAKITLERVPPPPAPITYWGQLIGGDRGPGNLNIQNVDVGPKVNVGVAQNGKWISGYVDSDGHPSSDIFAKPVFETAPNGLSGPIYYAGAPSIAESENSPADPNPAEFMGTFYGRNPNSPELGTFFVGLTSSVPDQIASGDPANPIDGAAIRAQFLEPGVVVVVRGYVQKIPFL